MSEREHRGASGGGAQPGNAGAGKPGKPGSRTLLGGPTPKTTPGLVGGEQRHGEEHPAAEQPDDRKAVLYATPHHVSLTAALGQESEPASIRLDNPGSVPIHIREFGLAWGGIFQPYGDGLTPIAPGGAGRVQVTYRPQGPAHRHDTLRVITDGGGVAAKVHLRGSVVSVEQSQADRTGHLVASLRAGGDPPLATYDQMLETMRAASELAQADGPLAGKTAHAVYERVLALTQSERLTRLRTPLNGMSKTDVDMRLDTCRAAALDLWVKAAGGASFDPDVILGRFQFGREPLRVLTGERESSAEITGLDRTTTKILAVEAVGYAAAIAPALWPLAVEEAPLIAFAAREVVAQVAIKALTNPLVATEIAGILFGIGLDVAESGVQGYLSRLTDPGEVIFILMQVANDYLSIKGAQRDWSHMTAAGSQEGPRGHAGSPSTSTGRDAASGSESAAEGMKVAAGRLRGAVQQIGERCGGSSSSASGNAGTAPDAGRRQLGGAAPETASGLGRMEEPQGPAFESTSLASNREPEADHALASTQHAHAGGPTTARVSGLPPNAPPSVPRPQAPATPQMPDHGPTTASAVGPPAHGPPSLPDAAKERGGHPRTMHGLAAVSAVGPTAPHDVSEFQKPGWPFSSGWLDKAEVVSFAPLEPNGHANEALRVELRGKDGRTASAVFKPRDGEKEGLRDNVTAGTYFAREVASSRLNDELGMDLVPPTVVKVVDGKVGSLQLFAEGAPKIRQRRGVKFNQADAERFRVLDYVQGNSDRHDGNILVREVGGQPKPVAIDNGLSFPEGTNSWWRLEDRHQQGARAPLLPETWELIASMDLERIAKSLAMSGLEKSAARHALRRAVRLQRDPNFLEEGQAAIDAMGKVPDQGLDERLLKYVEDVLTVAYRW